MRLSILMPLILCACATFPELDGTISEAAANAPYPALTSLPVAPAATGNEQAALNARIAALQARAARIRQIDLGALQ